MTKYQCYSQLVARLLLTMLALFLTSRANAQDTLQVSFSQEKDTLTRQHFIDRYENVFMTKVPTRQIFKVTTVGSQIQGSGINFAYEYKVLPSLSLEASLYSQLDRFDEGLAQQLLHFNWKQVSLWVNGKARWYYNMDQRISKGLSANNFSGTYVALSYEQSLGLTQMSTFGTTKVGRMGLLYGFQSRFFNRGHIDFSVGLFQKEAGPNYIYEDRERFTTRNFTIGTQANVGLAFGDWKRTSAAPFCDVLVCDEAIEGQWKVELPRLAVGLKNQTASISTAYERKIASLPVSVSAGLNAGYYHYEIFSSKSTVALLDAQLELRYYFLQSFLLRHGKAGNNFSGPYAGLRGGYSMTTDKVRYQYQPEWNFDKDIATPTGALALGYQQRLFKRIYVDGSIFWQKQYKSWFPGGTRPYISSKIGIGFTF
ncbi:hypothetical protein [Dyadobacter luticola]|uniref:DUF3575 domain-containing protein n=1 Tax=Dyadobacter luticola TaxID=1979387 RepID=A0A5R9L189_9BACT|nr:hypothetical protein [Dyadobacter luticola]TLV02178.1 hypothetical protein FEN17_00625 [Dyadobacter luticola]